MKKQTEKQWYDALQKKADAAKNKPADPPKPFSKHNVQLRNSGSGSGN